MAHGITHVGYPSGVIDLPTGFLRPNRITAVLSNVHTPGIVPDDAILTEAEEILNLENELYLALDEDDS